MVFLSYIEALKTETEIQHQHQVTESGDHQPPPATDSKKISELERTVFVLKRVVEKLQVENKRLVGGSRPCSALSDHSVSIYKTVNTFYRSFTC